MSLQLVNAVRTLERRLERLEAEVKALRKPPRKRAPRGAQSKTLVTEARTDG
jgi:hypothetical protein